MGEMNEFLKTFGKIPELRDLLNRIVNGDTIDDAVSFRNWECHPGPRFC